MTPISQALGAYSNAAGALGTSASSVSASGSGFADLLKGGAMSALQQSRQAENLSGKALQGNADITDVVNAVTNAEMALTTVVSLRDRMVASLQEVMRMPI